MSLEQALDTAIGKAIEQNRIVGAVTLVSYRGVPVYEKAHGLIDREAGRPMEHTAIFRLSSLTKPIVAATILAMHDDGQLALSDHVTRFFPDFRPALADGSQPPITIAHLLTHTSGIDNTPFASADALRENHVWRVDTEVYLATLAARPMLFAPGTSWAYGPSTDVLGAVAGKVVGGTPQDAMRRYVLDPIGMNDTRFSITDRSRLATPYADGPQGPERMNPVHSVVAPWGGTATYDLDRIFDPAAFQSGGGGMAGTAQDFMRLLEALRAGTLLKPETSRLALANQTQQLTQATAPGWQFSFLGAWLDDPNLGGWPALRGTNRWGGIYGHSWFIDPASELSVVGMTNTGLEGCDGPYRDQLASAVYAGLSN